MDLIMLDLAALLLCAIARVVAGPEVAGMMAVGLAFFLLMTAAAGAARE